MWTSACQTRPVPASTSAGQPASSSTSQPPVQTQSQPGLCLTLKSGATQHPLPTTKTCYILQLHNRNISSTTLFVGKPDDYCLQPPTTSTCHLHTSIPASFWVRHPFQECSSPSSTLYTSHPSFNPNSSISSKAMLIRARRLRSCEIIFG